MISCEHASNKLGKGKPKHFKYEFFVIGSVTITTDKEMNITEMKKDIKQQLIAMEPYGSYDSVKSQFKVGTV